MTDTEPIVNRVAQSPLVTIDLEMYFPQGERVFYDIASNLFQGVVLKEKDFREFLASHDWTDYSGKYVAIGCSADAIIPTWAYMLLATKINEYADFVILGDLKALETSLYTRALSKIRPEDYIGSKVVIKGCSGLPVPESAYVELTRMLQPVVQSIMFGEPCSTVPVFKRRKE